MKRKLFYSYSHKNQKYRDNIEKSLKQLKHDGLLHEWHDRSIIPGTSISEKIRKKLEDSDICMFLISADFIASDACKNEWNSAKEISTKKHVYRVPIILEDCPWKDFLGNDDVKALPEDGKPIKKFDDESTAYLQVYNGIKKIIENINSSHTPKEIFLDELKKTHFISQEEISIEDIFVFPSLIDRDSETESARKRIRDCDELLDKNHVILKGEENSGKTTLCKFLTIHLIKKNEPVLYIDLSEIEAKKPAENIFKKYYEEQFNGSFDIWKKQDKKRTVIFDGLIHSRNRKMHVLHAKTMFDRVVTSVVSDQYESFFYDDEDLIDFCTIEIKELSHVNTEELIKKRFSMIKDHNLNHKTLDDAEKKIDSILNSGFVERYPFYILSILQTFEAYMPNDLEITSYGHCYKALITANLIKSGIGNSDSDLTPCFNFFEHLAFEIFSDKNYSYSNFIKKYQEEYSIKNSILNKLSSDNNHITPLIKDGNFSQKYTYYFFLGSYFAKNYEKTKTDIQKLTSKNYVKDNNRILLFILHHYTNVDLIEDVLLESLCTLDGIPEARLDLKETKNIFDNIVKNLPDNIQSDKSVEEERRLEREIKDKEESEDKKEEDYDGSIESVNDLYKILKNNQLLGQVLRNHHGNLKKNKLKEIIEFIIGSGLRLVKLFLNEENIEDLAKYIKSKKPNDDIEMVRNFCRFFCFIITMDIIETVTDHISVDEIEQIIKEMELNDSPAYDLINYFTVLNTCNKYSRAEGELLKSLYKKHDDNIFMKKVLSLRTQYYFNTHKVNHKIKQSVFHTLGIPYKGR